MANKSAKKAAKKAPKAPGPPKEKVVKRSPKKKVSRAQKAVEAVKKALSFEPPDFVGWSRVPGTRYAYVAYNLEDPGARVSLAARKDVKIDWEVKCSSGCESFELVKDETDGLLIAKNVGGMLVFRVRSAQALELGRYTLILKSVSGEPFGGVELRAWPL